MTQTIASIKNIKRRELRYALFRVKAGTADETQLSIFDFYQQMISEFGYEIADFTFEWDIDKADVSNVVTGRVAKRYNQDRSLFANGSLKE